MPLLMCPNDNAPMQTIHRGGVEFDMCPTCRGVWLDRGELEKLMNASTEERPSAAQPVAAPWGDPRGDDHQRRHEEPKRRDHDREHDDRYDRHKKRGNIFDIFD